MVKIIPIGHYVTVELCDAKSTIEGKFITSVSGKVGPTEAKIISVGDEVRSKNIVSGAMAILEDDCGIPVSNDGKTLIVLDIAIIGVKLKTEK